MDYKKINNSDLIHEFGWLYTLNYLMPNLGEKSTKDFQAARTELLRRLSNKKSE